MIDWKSQFDVKHPCWDGYRHLLQRLPPDVYPSAESLTGLLPPGMPNQNGRPLRFVAADKIPGVSYEQHIFETGEISTREESWHDLFNALVWSRLPRLKAAMNAVHYENLENSGDGRRGKVRDALTLLDESGVIVTGLTGGVLSALADRDWDTAFVRHADAWETGVSIVVCGHAILEKFLLPYKSMTAHALFVHHPEPLPALDDLLADALLNGSLLSSTADLSPLPLMGIPGWWTQGAQDPAFYADKTVFRPPPQAD